MPAPTLLFGPMLIGTYFNAILYGIAIVQGISYFETYKRDSSWLKLFVAYLLFVETLNTGFSIGLIYEPLILKNGTPDATTFFPLKPLITVIISTPIQIFIAWRIRIISESRFIPGIITVLAIVSLGGGTWLTYTITAIRRFANKSDLHWPALMWLLASAIADVIITVSLVFSLIRRKTGYVDTDDTINQLIRMTIQTGMVTAIIAVLDVICFLVFPSTTVNLLWDLALSKLYTNALLSSLNARAALERRLLGQDERAGPTNVLFHTYGTLPTFHAQTDSFVIKNSLEASNSNSGSDGPIRPEILITSPVCEITEMGTT